MKKKPTRGGARVAGPGKRMGRPMIAPERRRQPLTGMVLPITHLRIAALAYQYRDRDGELATVGEVLDKIAELAHPEIPDD